MLFLALQEGLYETVRSDAFVGYDATVPDFQPKDLRVLAPRRWSDELGGMRWLPRMIDKAAAALRGQLGDYLYGECPVDRGLLRALGMTYKDFTAMVRAAGGEDEKVLQAIQKDYAAGIDLARRWSDRVASRYKLFLFLLDVDDGYAGGVAAPFASVIRIGSALLARYARYHSGSVASLVGLEVEAEHEGARAEAARGAEEEPYRWLTAQNLDYSWKILLSIVLIWLMLSQILHFVERLGVIFVIIVGAIFFAYLVYPVVRWLNNRLPLWASILLVYAVIATIVVVGLMYLIPAVSNEVTTLGREWPAIQRSIVALVRNPHNRLLAHTPPLIRDQLARLPAEVTTWLQTHGATAAGSAVMVLVGTASFIAGCVAIPVLAAYLLSDSETVKRFFMGFVPSRNRESTLQLLAELERVIGGFIRGQLLVGASVGLLIALGLTFIGEPYAILIGVMAALLDFIPYIGPVIAFIPALTIAAVAGGYALVLKAAIVFILANQAEGHIIAPNIVSRTIKLSPSAVLIAILVGGELYGILGMFIAVPVAGIIRVLLLHIIPGSVSRDQARPVLTKDPRERVEEAAAQ
ncbi:MAG TPA: AI-2E family transporter [Candidatus Baltobacteraceae bacterium]|nr:AI-2E family transporter [Candidatus Baltobacteraceae bacterium]